jgi:rare lipoprotein A
MSPRFLAASLAALVAVLAPLSQAQPAATPTSDAAPVATPATLPAPAAEVQSPAQAPVAEPATEPKPWKKRADMSNRSADAAEGRVAYYGRKFAGRKTASGERFNPNALTMAHRSLPFGTMVRITNLKNNKHVVVRVNDRGPSTPDRIGDLSQAAAVKLHMMKSGTAQVRMDVVGKSHGGAHKKHHAMKHAKKH